MRSWGSSGRPFYRRPGRREEEVASTGEACCDGDDGAQWWRRDGSGQAVRRDDSIIVHGDARHQFVQVSELMARRRGGWWPTTNAPMADHGRGGKGMTSGARLSERGRSRGRRVGAADGWGQAIKGECGAGKMVRVGREGGRSAGVRERGGAWARIGPTEREGFSFSFHFCFP